MIWYPMAQMIVRLAYRPRFFMVETIRNNSTHPSVHVSQDAFPGKSHDSPAEMPSLQRIYSGKFVKHDLPTTSHDLTKLMMVSTKNPKSLKKSALTL
jgi:hypothetical protein